MEKSMAITTVMASSMEASKLAVRHLVSTGTFFQDQEEVITMVVVMHMATTIDLSVPVAAATADGAPGVLEPTWRWRKLEGR